MRIIKEISGKLRKPIKILVVYNFKNATGAECSLDALLRADFFNIYKHVAVETRDLKHEPVTPEKVTYYLFTKDSPDDYVTLTQSKLNLLDNKKIVFFIHGWTNSREVEWYEGLKNAFLASYDDYYVVQVDWKEPARQYYYVSSINTYDVGKPVFVTMYTIHLHIISNLVTYDTDYKKISTYHKIC